MRIASLYDIHGNLPALEAALADVRRSGVDRIVVGGDLVPGPMPNECIDLLCSVEIPIKFIRGNGDRVTLAASRGEPIPEVPERFQPIVEWSAKALAPRNIERMTTWPANLAIDSPHLGRILFCHATPKNDTDVFLRTTDEDKLAAYLAGTDADLIVCGHMHMQFDRQVGSWRIVNSGSIGSPYGEAGAYWLLIDEDVERRKTVYDFEGAARLIVGTSYPQAEEYSRSIVAPNSEAETLEAFSKFEFSE